MPDTPPVAEIGGTTAGPMPHLPRGEADARLHRTAAGRPLALNLGGRERAWSARNRVSTGWRGLG